jgi:starch phosphorylase
MKASMKRLSPIFSTNRMVAEYAERFYLPAARRLLYLAGDKAKVQNMMEWRKRLRDHGEEVKVTQVQLDGGSREFLVGSRVKVAAKVSLGGVHPDDVRVQAYYGVLTAEGQIAEGGSHLDLVLHQSWGTEHLFEGEVECGQSGTCGFAVRVVPFHQDAVLPYEMPWIRWEQ